MFERQYSPYVRRPGVEAVSTGYFSIFWDSSHFAVDPGRPVFILQYRVSIHLLQMSVMKQFMDAQNALHTSCKNLVSLNNGMKF